jgi:glutamine amidotransferase
MQALMAHSDENQGVDCLGIFPGQVERFPEMTDALLQPLKVPHMGWNQVRQTPHVLWQDIPDLSRFYFVHSYRIPDLPESWIAGCCDYGQPFVAACARGNVFAVQFHPEKSAPHGLTLLRNFLSWTP